MLVACIYLFVHTLYSFVCVSDPTPHLVVPLTKNHTGSSCTACTAVFMEGASQHHYLNNGGLGPWSGELGHVTMMGRLTHANSLEAN